MAITAPAPRVLADLVPSTVVRQIALIVGGAAFIGLSAQIAFYLPWNPAVPVTLQTFAVVLGAAALGRGDVATGDRVDPAGLELTGVLPGRVEPVGRRIEMRNSECESDREHDGHGEPATERVMPRPLASAHTIVGVHSALSAVVVQA